MKKIFYLLIATAMFAGCEYLDKEPDDMKTDKMVWSNRAEVVKYLTNCYASLPMDRLHQDDPWLGCADECDIPWSVYPTYNINLGVWEPSTSFYVKWNTFYRTIRATFVFENNVGKCGNLSQDLKDRYLGEALFLRGYYYFLLLRQYGPVVLIKQQMSNDTDFGNMPRSPFDECAAYVCELMDRAERLLPDSYASEADNLGRATAAAALSVKAMMLMLQASPQWNGNPDYADFVNHDGTHLASTTADSKRWETAAEAYRAVIDKAEATNIKLYTNGDVGVDSKDFNPYKSYYNLFNNGWNSEIIFGSIDQGTISWDNHGERYAWMVHTIPEGAGSATCMGAVGPTLRLVDAFYMENGRTIEDPNSGYIERGFATKDGEHYNFSGVDMKTEAGRKTQIRDLKNLDAWGHAEGDWNMFCNREPRFYASINYNHRVQLPYSDDAGHRNGFNMYASQQDGWGRCELYFGGKSNSGQSLNYSMTGFLTQKRVVAEAEFYTRMTLPGKYVSIYIRYAQILLDYIEALNEYDPTNPDIQKYWDDIRKRAGLPSIFATYPDIKGKQKDQREYILRERQIELNFEGDRYYTTRRRLLSETVAKARTDKYGDAGSVWGLSVRGGDPKTNNFKSTEFYEPVAFEQRVFKKAYYLFPIPQSETDKSPALVQNPGW